MSVLAKKSNFKDMSIPKDTETEKRGRSKKEAHKKRDKVYAFYCSDEEFKELEAKAKQRHLTMAEYFRMKLFAEWKEKKWL